MKIGYYNKLKIARTTDFGLYLADEQGLEVLLPMRYVTPEMRVGNDIDVFVYRDSEDRPVATTETPRATAGEFAFLKATSVNSVGAFLDWGLPKDLLVPFSEQKVRMEPGRWYIIYIYVDDNTGRLVASAKLDKFLGNVIPKYRSGDITNILVWQRTELGFKVIADNLHHGMIYHSELATPLNIGERHQAKVKRVRPDGKLDLTLGGSVGDRTAALCSRIMEMLDSSGGSIPFSDATAPESIRETFQCSKKDFKKAIGHLFKERKIKITEKAIYRVE